MKREYVPPKAGEDGFNCPACGAFAHQRWHRAELRELPWDEVAESSPGPDIVRHLEVAALALSNPVAAVQVTVIEGVAVSKCERCNEPAIWLGERLLWPKGGLAPQPNLDLPEGVRRLYEEANSIARESPRAAAMIVRLAIEELCRTLVPKEKLSLDRRIRELVKNGLSSRTQKALDAVRVIGNQAAHLGQLDSRDDGKTAYTLLSLVNMIAEEVISRPKAVNAIYETLPDGVRKQIASADGPGVS